jgi:tetratricopeptide (TPR) repeat protein
MEYQVKGGYVKKISTFGGAGLILSILITGCQSKSPDYYAGYTDEIKAMLASVDSVFFAKRFAEAEEAYRNILATDSECVDARVGLGRALRYQGKLKQAAVEFEKAYQQDKKSARTNLYYGKSLVPWYGMAPEDKSPDQLVKQATKLMVKALRADPELMDAHLSLWTTYIYSGEYEKADGQMKALVDKKLFPKQVSDYGYNLLVGADQDAIIFTNGDMDTYPLLALQASEGFRSDVRVVNINLLNLAWYAGYVRDQLGVPISYTDEKLSSLQPRMIAMGQEKKLELVADVLVADILSAADVPVYFAMVPEDRIATYTDNAIREGLLVKAEREPVTANFNRDRAIENVEKLYQIDVGAEKVNWTSNTSPLTRNIEGLLINYAAIYQAIASDYIEQDMPDAAVPYLKKAVDVCRKIGDSKRLKDIIGIWLELFPDDPQALALQKSLD